MKLDESTAAQIKEIHAAFCGREKERDESLLEKSIDALGVAVSSVQGSVQTLSNQFVNIDSRLEEVERKITPNDEIQRMINRAENGLKSQFESRFKDYKIEELEKREISKVVDMSKYQESFNKSKPANDEGKSLSQRAVIVATSIGAGLLAVFTLIREFTR